MPERVARRFLISGRVQGVGFRYFVRSAGQRLGLSGWVRNLHDGRVEALAEGAAGSVEALHETIRTGPPGARVTAIEVTEMTEVMEIPGAGLKEFRIRFEGEGEPWP